MKGLSSFTYESVRKWFKRLREALPRLRRVRREVVAADEAKLKLRDKRPTSGQP